MKERDLILKWNHRKGKVLNIRDGHNSNNVFPRKSYGMTFQREFLSKGRIIKISNGTKIQSRKKRPFSEEQKVIYLYNSLWDKIVSKILSTVFKTFNTFCEDHGILVISRYFWSHLFKRVRKIGGQNIFRR